MTEFDRETALDLMKARLNRLPEDTALDDYFRALIEAEAEALEGTGIHLNYSARDTQLIVNHVVFAYSNRDKNEPVPDWLRLQRRERWLQERRAGT